MEIERTNQRIISLEERQELERLKKIINNAVADGKLTRAELDAIRVATFADKQVSVAELELYRKLVLDKFENGELEMDYYDQR